MTKLADIRQTFLDFFAGQEKGLDHTIETSSPLVPRNDPSLMFTTAGMVQFKDVFTGKETRSYTRAATSQKCVRAGGKHNDLENVGYTTRHHTFFEMLGNFSFGDYFKAEAIDMSWRLITDEFALPKDKLLVTVHTSDEEAADLWKKIAGLTDEKIIRIPTDDNFWSMGETGPCGPCTEIFFDHGPNLAGGPPGSPDEDGERFVEIWNLVFMQFEQISAEQRVDLPKPSIDTGMGLERIAAVLQGVHDNYDVDLFRHIINATESIIGTTATGAQRPSFKVIADHLRSCCFLMADGVTPSNEGRGYVLRRILRRAARHAHLLGAKDPVLWQLVPALVGEMGNVYPELGRAQALMTETLKLEEARFRQTLEKGLKILQEEAAAVKDGMLPGDVAFKLYDTYGFPLDLTQDALRVQDIKVDEEGFQTAMQVQREMARAAWSGSGETATDKLWYDLRDRLGATEFLGYDTETAQGKILGIVVDGEEVYELKNGQTGILILNQTPFYGESGGQIGDTGTISGEDGQLFDVTDTQKRLGNMFLHIGQMQAGESLKVGEDVRLDVNEQRRRATRANHSATHLMHEALRNILGEHVTQKGSFVGPDRLRFDISHPKALTAEEMAKVEAEVNERIRANTAVKTILSTPDEAMASGAMALFGEKYGDEVRVVMMGDASSAQPQKAAWSVELCGGTHVRRTGDIGMFKVVGDSALAAGVRRIEALTGRALYDHVNEQLHLLEETAHTLKVAPRELPQRLTALLEERRTLDRQLADARKKLAMGGGASANGNAEIETIGDYKFIGRVMEDIPAKDLKGMVDGFKQKLGSGVVSLISIADGKASLVVGVTSDLTDRLSAVDLVRVGAEALGGSGGGGRPDLAQAGGPDTSNPKAALESIAKQMVA